MKLGQLFISTVLFCVLLAKTAPAGARQTERLWQHSPSCLESIYLPLIIHLDGSNSDTAQPQAETAVTQSEGPSPQPDFNGDGCADLAIGVSRESLDSGGNQGMVQVMYGSSDGVTAVHSQVWHRGGGYDRDGTFLGDIQGELRANDQFGETLATGDFNHDGYSDLAVGIQYSLAAAHPNAGAVQILYGSEHGLTAVNNQYWTQDGGWVDPEGDGQGNFLGDIYGGPEDDDRFGSSLTVGNFNGDEYADLAIGVKYEDIGNITSAGAVNILFGTADGLTWVGNQFLSQDELRGENDGSGDYTYLGDLVAHAEEYDYFGYTLAAGNFDGDAFDDLAIGVWGEGIGSLDDAGAIHIVRGSSDGLTPLNNDHWHQQAAYRDTDGDGQFDVTIGNPDGTEESNDWFGYSLAAGNFDDDPYDDLAIGVPNEDIWIDGIEYIDTGVTQVFYGSLEGLSLDNEQWWQQDGEYTIGTMSGSDPEDYDKFGTVLTTGDINGDGMYDLIIGTPNEGFANIGGNVGSVNVIYGSADGLNLPNHQWLYQNAVIKEGTSIGSLVGEASFNTYFGQAIMTADFNNDGYEELVIGVPGYKLDGSNDEIGAINIVQGSGDGLIIAGNQLWHQDGGWDDEGNFLGDLFDEAEDNDAFGNGLP